MPTTLPDAQPQPAARHAVRVGTLDCGMLGPPDFDVLLDEAARLTPDNVDRIPYYASLWPSARALADVLWEWRATLAGTRVLELGCGLGLPSVVAARLGAQVTATDFHPDAGAWCQANAAAHGVAVAFRAGDWCDLPDWQPFDLVMGSDLLYEARHLHALAACMGRLCAPAGAVLLADPGRQHLPQFVTIMQDAGWRAELLPQGEIYVIAFRRP